MPNKCLVAGGPCQLASGTWEQRNGCGVWGSNQGMPHSGSRRMFCLFGVEATGTEPRVVDLDEPSPLLSCQAGQSCAAEQLLQPCARSWMCRWQQEDTGRVWCRHSSCGGGAPVSAGTAPPASLHALGTGIQSLAQQLGCLSMHGAGESVPQILELGLAAAAAAAPQGSGRAGLWEDRRVAEELG